MLEYLQMLHDNAEASGLHPGCGASPEDVGLDPEVCTKIMAYFDRALEQASSDEVRARVEKASICAHRAMLDAGGPVSAEERSAQVERYIGLCERHGMTRAAEHKPAAEFFDFLRSGGAAGS